MTEMYPEPSDVPHVFIVGAGASRAALPNGDAAGKHLPVMADFVETLGLEELARTWTGYEPGMNFEVLYSTLSGSRETEPLARQLEERVRAYFAGLRLPDEPTLYDHLVLSLRPKDLIATFNWDPFLVQALIRNRDVADAPHAVFLHGNVAVAYCTQHRPIGMGSLGGRCAVCRELLGESRLLFPVAEKNYNSDPAIAGAWRILQEYLRNAACVTFFGYGAPTTDVEAIELLKAGWGSPDERNMEEAEIIDVIDDEVLRRRWSPFIHSHHYQIATSFYDSIAGQSPRRSTEQLFKAHFLAEFITPFPIPRTATWDELRSFLLPLLQQERASPPRSSANS